MMALTDQGWPSDNTDPYDRLSMQDGFIPAFTPAVMMAWVSDSPSWADNRQTSLTYRFLSAMQGGLGIGANLNTWSEVHVTTATRLILSRASLYRVIPAGFASARIATLYVAPDKRQALLFAFLHSRIRPDRMPAIHMAGLDPVLRYRVRAIDAEPMTARDAQRRSVSGQKIGAITPAAASSADGKRRPACAPSVKPV